MQNQIQAIAHEKECLDHVRDDYKNDIIVLKRKSESEKDFLMKTRKNLIKIKNNINSQEDQNNLYFNRLQL